MHATSAPAVFFVLSPFQSWYSAFRMRLAPSLELDRGLMVCVALRWPRWETFACLPLLSLLQMKAKVLCSFSHALSNLSSAGPVPPLRPFWNVSLKDQHTLVHRYSILQFREPFSEFYSFPLCKVWAKILLSWKPQVLNSPFTSIFPFPVQGRSLFIPNDTPNSDPNLVQDHGEHRTGLVLSLTLDWHVHKPWSFR